MTSIADTGADENDIDEDEDDDDEDEDTDDGIVPWPKNLCASEVASAGPTASARPSSDSTTRSPHCEKKNTERAQYEYAHRH